MRASDEQFSAPHIRQTNKKSGVGGYGAGVGAGVGDGVRIRPGQSAIKTTSKGGMVGRSAAGSSSASILAQHRVAQHSNAGHLAAGHLQAQPLFNPIASEHAIGNHIASLRIAHPILAS